MNVSCPVCHNQLINTPALSMAVVTCPHCQHQIQMPAFVAPAAATAPPNFTDSGPTINPYRSSVSSSSRSRRPKSSAAQVVKYLMLGATALWLMSMFGIFVLAAGSSVKDRREIGGNMVMDERTGDVYDRDAYNAGTFFGASCVGLCMPTIPYAIAMIALSVTYFAMKPERR